MILLLLIAMYFYFAIKNQEIQAKRDLEARMQWEQWDKEWEENYTPELWGEPETEIEKKIKQWLKEVNND
jgi:hypothetical protein